MAAMTRLFQVMSDKKPSDIFISVGATINIKINGNAVPINQTIMTAETVKQLLYEVLNERQIKEYEEEMELNTAYALENVGAFRISAFRQKGAPAVVVRFIPGSIPPLDSLGLPDVLKEIVMQKRGLILMVGATGSGKSTSLSAMLDFRNERKSGHILTLEDPVEFIFQNKKSIVNQREVGTDTRAFDVALKNALRQAPDVILIGEIRDIKEALEKSMSPGSQTFEQALFKLFMEGKITQEEAMANADSATNMLWLINQATAGEISGQSVPAPTASTPAAPKKEEEEK